MAPALKLTLNNVNFARNEQPLFPALNCNVYAGELLQVYGANGSGKSTLLRMLAGLLEPSAGNILWQDQPIQTHENYATQIGYLGHLNGLKPALTVMENLRLSCALRGVSLPQHALHAGLQELDLYALKDQLAFSLSAGQARRLALTRVILQPAQLWLLDEPLTALDEAGQQLWLGLLQKHLMQGGMAVVATHQELQVEGKKIRIGE